MNRTASRAIAILCIAVVGILPLLTACSTSTIESYPVSSTIQSGPPWTYPTPPTVPEPKAASQPPITDENGMTLITNQAELEKLRDFIRMPTNGGLVDVSWEEAEQLEADRILFFYYVNGLDAYVEGHPGVAEGAEIIHVPVEAVLAFVNQYMDYSREKLITAPKQDTYWYNDALDSCDFNAFYGFGSPPYTVTEIRHAEDLYLFVQVFCEEGIGNKRMETLLEIKGESVRYLSNKATELPMPEAAPSPGAPLAAALCLRDSGSLLWQVDVTEAPDLELLGLLLDPASLTPVDLPELPQGEPICFTIAYSDRTVQGACYPQVAYRKDGTAILWVDTAFYMLPGGKADSLLAFLGEKQN